MATYARVSSDTQRGDLGRRVEALKLWVSKNLPRAEYVVVTDVASGLSEGRREVQAVVVAYRDRLTGFGSEHLKALFSILGADVYVTFQGGAEGLCQGAR